MTPTEDKELIERLALESIKALRLDDPVACLELCERFLAAYLAERGKEARAWLNTRYETLHHANCVDTCADVSELAPLFLAPPALVEKDAALLNWIERQDFDLLDFILFKDHPNDGKYGVKSTGSGWSVGATLREALHAAIAKEPK